MPNYTTLTAPVELMEEDETDSRSTTSTCGSLNTNNIPLSRTSELIPFPCLVWTLDHAQGAPGRLT